MDFIRFKLDFLKPFTILKSQDFQQLLDQLQRCVTFFDLKKVFKTSHVFQDPSAHFCVWHIQSSKPVEIYSSIPLISDDIIMILQYRDRIDYHDLDLLIHTFTATPLQGNVHALDRFMKSHNVLTLSLLQYSGEMVGILAVVMPAGVPDMLEQDIQTIRRLSNSLTSTIINVESIDRLSNHQMILEDVNAALSYMNLFGEKEKLKEQVILSLIKVIPKMHYFALLSYDGLSGFFRQSTQLTKASGAVGFRLHADDILDRLNDNVLCKFFVDQSDLPNQLKEYMMLIGAKQSIVIRLDDADVSSIFIAFFKSPTDISDSNISYCQMLLRQYELFLDNQEKFDKLSKLQQFLTGLLDHLPTGIVIVNSNCHIVFSNNKFNAQFTSSGENMLNLPLPDQLLFAFNGVNESSDTYVKQIQLDDANSNDWYLLSGFQIFQEKEPHVVLMLTNIQQSKELIEQMNQANRLAMMSKIAHGISYELKAPVQQLLSGVNDIKSNWQDEAFQDHFTTVVIPQVDRINLLCQSLLRLSRTNIESLVNVYLPDLLDQVMRLIAGDLQYSNHAFYIGFLEKKSLVIDQVMAIQVLMNLMIFSLKILATEKSKLFLEIRVIEDEFLNLKVSVQEYTSQSFVDENDLKEHLELSIVNQIVINQNGRFDIDCSNRVTTFNVFLPIQLVPDSDLITVAKDPG